MMRFSVLVLLAFAVALVSAGSAAPGTAQKTIPVSTTATAITTGGKVAANGQYLVESDGRVVMLRGFNVAGSGKVPDFRPVKDLSRLNNLRDVFGANYVRLTFFWEAYEPTRGVYNTSYLEYQVGITQKLAELGIYVVVDLHSDGFSRFLLEGCGSGFPLWTIPSGVPTYTPRNNESCNNWFFLNEDPTKTAYTAFYNNTNGVRTQYLRMLDNISKRFAQLPNVIGYEPLNEPHGNVATEIGPLYVDATTTVRKNHPDALMFLCQDFASVKNNNFGSVFNPPQTLARLGGMVMAFHYYDPSLFIGFRIWVPLFPVDISMRNVAKVALTWNGGSAVPAVFTEFGAPGTLLNNDLIKEYYNYLDNDFVGGAQWNWSPNWDPVEKDRWNREDFSVVDDKNAVRTNLWHVRPVPRRFAGTPTQFKTTTSGDTTTVVIRWTQDVKTLGKPTEVFIPRSLIGSKTMQLWYDSSKNVPADCEYSSSAQVLLCTAKAVGDVYLGVQW